MISWCHRDPNGAARLLDEIVGEEGLAHLSVRRAMRRLLKWQGNRLEDIRKAQTETAERRRQLLEAQRARKARQPAAASASNKDQPSPAEPGPFASVDLTRAMDAARRLRLMTLDMEVGVPAALNRPTCQLLRAFLEALTARESAVVLQWPFGPRDASYLHPLGMLALLCAPQRKTTDGLTWCEASPDFRTLYYPWRGGATSAVQKSHLIRRNEILDRNKYHLTRSRVSGTADVSLCDKLHNTLGHLNRLSNRDEKKPHLAHPALAEIYPVFVAEGGEPPPAPFRRPETALFERVQFGAALGQMTDYRPDLSHPHSAPFGFFGVSARAGPRAALSARALSAAAPGGGRPPDICLLDLGPPALRRMGPNWEEMISDFIAEAKKRFPGMSFFVVTQDPYVQKRLTKILRDLLKGGLVGSRVMLRVTRDPLSDDPEVKTVSDIAAQFLTVAGPTTDAIRALSEAARGSSDPGLAGTLRREIGSLRKAASLPCGIAQAYDILCEEIGQSDAETFLEYRSAGTTLAPIEEALASEIGGSERARLLEARDAVKRAFAALDSETPIGSLFADLAATLARKSSRTVIAFGSPRDLLLGRRRLETESDQGRALARRIEKGHMKLASADTLDCCLSEIENTRHPRQGVERGPYRSRNLS